MRTNLRGFTLMEIIITVMIAGALASIAFFNFGTIIEKSTAREAQQTLHAIFANTQRVKIETGSIINVLVGVTDPFADNIPVSGNFLPPTYGWNGDPRITYTVTRRAPLSYTLTMVVRQTTTSPVITCSGGPAGLCARLGY